jgi:putative lipoprotein (rSAM/lipoprotein system)
VPEYGAPVAAEYGTPYVELIVKGKVTDPDGKPIPGIQVRPFYRYDGGHDYSSGKYLTDDAGVLEKTLYETHGTPEALNFAFEDLDGPENGGRFAKDTVYHKDLDIKKVDEGSDHWSEGKFEVIFEKKLRPAEDGE